MNHDNKAVLIYSNYSTFVKADDKILSKFFIIKKYRYIHKKSIIYHFFNQIKLFFWLLKNIYDIKLIYIWFGDYHSLLPILFGKFFKKKTMLVLGGYDVANIPELKYGAFTSKIRTFFVRNSIAIADLNLCVSDNIEKDALDKVPNAKTKIVYTGYDKDIFKFGNKERENIILTVASCNTYKRLKIKGIDHFVNFASKLPEYKFVIIGDAAGIKKYCDVPDNLEIIDLMPHHDLIKYYQKAKIFAQFSIREGLPNAVCEAMLCGCIPVGYSNGGIPIAIGDCGYLSNGSDNEQTLEILREAMNSSIDFRKKARQRIIENFSLEKREYILTKILQK